MAWDEIGETIFFLNICLFWIECVNGRALMDVYDDDAALRVIIVIFLSFTFAVKRMNVQNWKENENLW